MPFNIGETVWKYMKFLFGVRKECLMCDVSDDLFIHMTCLFIHDSSNDDVSKCLNRDELMNIGDELGSIWKEADRP
jgi:hypothetical protein